MLHSRCPVSRLSLSLHQPRAREWSCCFGCRQKAYPMKCTVLIQARQSLCNLKERAELLTIRFGIPESPVLELEGGEVVEAAKRSEAPSPWRWETRCVENGLGQEYMQGPGRALHFGARLRAAADSLGTRLRAPVLCSQPAWWPLGLWVG